MQLPAELKHSSRSKLAALRERAPQAESLNANTRKGGHHKQCSTAYARRIIASSTPLGNYGWAIREMPLPPSASITRGVSHCQHSAAGGTLRETHYCEIPTSKTLAIEADGLPQEAQSNSTSTKMSLFVLVRFPSSGSGCGARRFSQGGRGASSSMVIPLPQRVQSRCVGTGNKYWVLVKVQSVLKRPREKRKTCWPWKSPTPEFMMSRRHSP